MTIYSLFTFSGGLVSLLLGITVLFKKRSLSCNKSFVLMCLSICLWLFSYTVCYSTSSEKLAVNLARVACTAVVFVGTTFYHFIVSFLKVEKERKFVWLAYILSFIQLPIFLFTNYFISGVYRYFWGYYSKAGLFHPFFLIFFFSLCIRGLYLLLQAFLSQKKEMNPYRFNQIKYVFYASNVIVLGSIDFIPKYGIEIFPFGFFFILLYMLITAYAIIRYQLMDVRLAVTKGGLFSIIYAFVISVPFMLGYKFAYWSQALWLMALLATGGPYVYIGLQRKAEERLLKEQRRYQGTLKQAAVGMTRIRQLRKLL
ncbi:MAG: hypothetical protein N2606_00190, partial [Candidatus Omnitrophica bacterium]|nr:hypothetical protein [Candidatus Omnitrophota bacterium]